MKLLIAQLRKLQEKYLICVLNKEIKRKIGEIDKANLRAIQNQVKYNGTN